MGPKQKYQRPILGSFEYCVGQRGAFESKWLRTANLDNIWIFSNCFWIVSNSIKSSVSLKELRMSAICLLAKAEAEIVIIFPCSYYMKIFMLWKLLTTFVTTELTPSLLWSQSKRLQAAQSNDGALRSLSSGNELMSHTPEKQKH